MIYGKDGPRYSQYELRQLKWQRQVLIGRWAATLFICVVVFGLVFVLAGGLEGLAERLVGWMR